MFCSSCGHNISEVKGDFCPNCGLVCKARQTAYPSITKGANKINVDDLYKGIISLIATALVVSMAYGWLTPPVTEGGPQAWIAFGDILGGGGRWSVFSSISLMAWSGAAISIVGITAFLFLLFKESSKAHFVGLLSLALATLISLGYIVYIVTLFDGRVTVIGGVARYLSEDFIRINTPESVGERMNNPSIWAYMTLVLGLVGTGFMLLYKRRINSMQTDRSGQEAIGHSALSSNTSASCNLRKSIVSAIAIVSIASMSYGWVLWPMISSFSGVRLTNWHNVTYQRLYLLTDIAAISTNAWIGTSISVFGFAAFLFLLNIKSRIAGLVGIASSLIATAMSLMFIHHLWRSLEPQLLDSVRRPYPSIWAYLTLVVGLVGIVFMVKFRKDLST